MLWISARKSAVFAVVGGTCHYDVAVFDSDVEVGVNGLSELAFGAFHSNGVGFFINLNINSLGDCDGGFTYS